MSWFTKFKEKRKARCGLCKKNPITEDSAIIQMNCADGVHEVVVCDQCLESLSPIIGGDLD